MATEHPQGLTERLDLQAAKVDMEQEFLSVGLDIIGLGVFNYDFSSITTQSPVIKVLLLTSCSNSFATCPCCTERMQTACWQGMSLTAAAHAAAHLPAQISGCMVPGRRCTAC